MEKKLRDYGFHDFQIPTLLKGKTLKTGNGTYKLDKLKEELTYVNVNKKKQVIKL